MSAPRTAQPRHLAPKARTVTLRLPASLHDDLMDVVEGEPALTLNKLVVLILVRAMNARGLPVTPSR